MLKSALFQQITVVGNELLFESLYGTLSEVKVELQRLDDATQLDCEQLVPLRTVMEILEGFETA